MKYELYNIKAPKLSNTIQEKKCDVVCLSNTKLNIRFINRASYTKFIHMENKLIYKGGRFCSPPPKKILLWVCNC